MHLLAVSPEFILLTYQQLPRSPCEMSSGRGVLHTAHLTFSSPCRGAAISVGLSHWMDDLVNGLFSFRNTDVGAGGKESSTKWSLCWSPKIYIVTELKNKTLKSRKKSFQFYHTTLIRKTFKNYYSIHIYSCIQKQSLYFQKCQSKEKKNF